MLVVPPSFTAEQVKASGAQAVFLSNGPGDPATLTDEIRDHQEARRKLSRGGHLPRPSASRPRSGRHDPQAEIRPPRCNHPVKDLSTGHVEISSQNHGFCVDIDNVSDVVVTHVNLNDGTLEGFAHKTKPILAVQHHPRPAPAPSTASISSPASAAWSATR